VIEPSGIVASDEVDALADAIEERLADFSGVALCGSSPPGAEGLYDKVVSRLGACDACTLLLDGVKQVEEVLSSGRLDVLKLNLMEVKALSRTESAAAAAELLFAEDGALRRRGAVLAITDGPRPALLFSSAQLAWRLHVPAVACVNAIGAGDVCTAIFLYELVRARCRSCQAGETLDEVEAGAQAADAFAWGLAAASARCGHEKPTFEREEVEELRASIRIERLHV